MRTITCFGDFPYINCLGLSDEDNSVTGTDNSISPCVLSYRCVSHYFLTMPMGFNVNLTFGLKLSVASKL